MATKPRNVLFIISDQHKRAWSEPYGATYIKTPHLAALAARGVTFTQAYCNSPLCAPSRASYMTGTHPHENRSLFHQEMIGGAPREPGLSRLPGYRLGLSTMADTFRARGFRTGSFGKMHVHGETRQHDLGFDERGLRFYTYKYQDYIDEVGVDRVHAYIGKAPYDRGGGYNVLHAPVPLLKEEEMYDHRVTERGLDFIRRHRGVPFFLHIGLEKPHPPWTEVKRFMDLYDPAAVPDSLLPGSRHEDGKDHVPAWCHARRSDDEIRHSLTSYAATITSMDEKVGRLVETLKECGAYDDTLIVYTTDHGEMAYEHGQIEKHCMYEAAVGVPLIIAGPGIEAPGRRCEDLTSLVDLYPTLAEAVGSPVPPQCQGRSLGPVLMGGSMASGVPVFSEFHQGGYRTYPGVSVPMRMMRTETHKYIYTWGHGDQLYAAGSAERPEDNLAAARPDLVKEMKRCTLAGWDTGGELAPGFDLGHRLGVDHLRVKENGKNRFHLAHGHGDLDKDVTGVTLYLMGAGEGPWQARPVGVFEVSKDGSITLPEDDRFRGCRGFLVWESPVETRAVSGYLSFPC